MYKQECYKIFSKKSIYFVFAIIVLLLVYVNSLPLDMTMKEEFFEELEQTWGGPVTEEMVSIAKEAMHASDAGEVSKNTFESRATDYVQFLVVGASMRKDEQSERIQIRKEQLEQFSSGTYEYREALKERNMLGELEEAHGFYLIRSWRGMFELIEPVTSLLLLSTLIFIGVTPVFAEEYTKRTTDLILATKHGKRKLVSAKIMAVVTYIAIVFLSLQLVNILLKLWKFGGVAGWDAPIQGISAGFDSHSFVSYDGSPYSFEVWQFFLITLGLHLLACLAVGSLVLFLSFLTKNTMLAFFISGVVIAVPVLLQQLGITRGILEYVVNFSYTELMQVSSMFTQFRAYNIFGFPVLYPSLIFSVFAVITGVMIFLIYKLFGKQQVGN
ncbi:hypothetical protein ACERII_24420 [Evansella sp. AB-rgal1]|uniref:hypothetical protein n=1 Tax=Evansella sp. AB-rgal1 TaxID=3242696 RepID=UPI00359E33FF